MTNLVTSSDFSVIQQKKYKPPPNSVPNSLHITAIFLLPQIIETLFYSSRILKTITRIHVSTNENMLFHIAIQVTSLNSNNAKPINISIPTSLTQVQRNVHTYLALCKVLVGYLWTSL
jgi:hypothetical protein